MDGSAPNNNPHNENAPDESAPDERGTSPASDFQTAAGAQDADPSGRRNFLSYSTTAAMAGGLVAGYGTFFAMAGRFVFPANGTPTAWQFVAALRDMAVGESLEYETPAGVKVVIARQSEATDADAFIALSSVCPHLGCQVHWESQNDRFFCPCHNGVFDAQGKPQEGPPATANQELLRFPLKVENDLLYIEVPTESVARDSGREA